MRQVIIKTSYIVDRFCRPTAVIFFIVMLVLILFQVVARYIFQAVPVWTGEAARYCMVWGGLLGATVAFKADSDPRLIQPPKGGSRWKIRTAALLRGLAVIVFLGPVVYHSGSFLVRTLQRTSEAMGISMVWITLAVPVSIAIILFHLFAKVVESGISRSMDDSGNRINADVSHKRAGKASQAPFPKIRD